MYFSPDLLLSIAATMFAIDHGHLKEVWMDQRFSNWNFKKSAWRFSFATPPPSTSNLLSWVMGAGRAGPFSPEGRFVGVWLFALLCTNITKRVACIAGAWKSLSVRKNGRSRERETRKGRGNAYPRGPWKLFPTPSPINWQCWMICQNFCQKTDPFALWYPSPLACVPCSFFTS